MEINEINDMFLSLYGDNGEELRVFVSPGRVNLIGEHVDYCGGPVFPAALTMRTAVVARKRKDNVIRLRATDLDVCVEAKLDELEQYKDKLKWGDYQLGVALELQKAGYELCGCDLLYDDTVPHGSGLSSSAAIEVSTALCLATFARETAGDSAPVDMIEMALIGQKAEHNFIGVKCGIMDQFASAMGKANHAIYLECDTLNYETVPLAMDGYKLILSNTNKKHALGDSKYNERRQECSEGLQALQTVLPNIKHLSEVSTADFEKYSSVIENEVVRRRIKHVVTECERVRESVKALKADELEKFGALINASHDSLQYDYEVSCEELDILVREARKLGGVLGTRMTGAGFGGCTVSVVCADMVEEFIQTVGSAYEKAVGYPAAFYISEIGDGGREIK